jgi:hypothetical protein
LKTVDKLSLDLSRAVVLWYRYGGVHVHKVGLDGERGCHVDRCS